MKNWSELQLQENSHEYMLMMRKPRQHQYQYITNNHCYWLMFLQLQQGSRACTSCWWSISWIRGRSPWESSPSRTHRWTPGLRAPAPSSGPGASPGRCPQTPVHRQTDVTTLDRCFTDTDQVSQELLNLRIWTLLLHDACVFVTDKHNKSFKLNSKICC